MQKACLVEKLGGGGRHGDNVATWYGQQDTIENLIMILRNHIQMLLGDIVVGHGGGAYEHGHGHLVCMHGYGHMVVMALGSYEY